jgi:acetyl esterase/lipase
MTRLDVLIACTFLMLTATRLLGEEPAVPVPDSISVESIIPYSGFRETVLDIIRPKAASKRKRPGVLIIHEGGWPAGDKEHLMSFRLAWAKQGFVVANIEYRLAKTAPAPAAISDSLAAAKVVPPQCLALSRRSQAHRGGRRVGGWALGVDGGLRAPHSRL